MIDHNLRNFFGPIHIQYIEHALNGDQLCEIFSSICQSQVYQGGTSQLKSKKKFCLDV